jgi:hypothetical protein
MQDSGNISAIGGGYLNGFSNNDVNLDQLEGLAPECRTRNDEF